MKDLKGLFGSCCGRINRRTFLADSGMGFTGLVLGAMLQRDGIARAATLPEWAPPDGKPHFPPKAKSVIWIFMLGGVSHVEEDGLLASDPAELRQELLGDLLLRLGVDPVHGGDQELDEGVGDLLVSGHPSSTMIWGRLPPAGTPELVICSMRKLARSQFN